jgi:hypothetical protein
MLPQILGDPLARDRANDRRNALDRSKQGKAEDQSPAQPIPNCAPTWL